MDKFVISTSAYDGSLYIRLFDVTIHTGKLFNTKSLSTSYGLGMKEITCKRNII